MDGRPPPRRPLPRGCSPVGRGHCIAALEILGGNVHLLLAAAIVAGFRQPAAWAFVLLTKVTPRGGPAVVRGAARVAQPRACPRRHGRDRCRVVGRDPGGVGRLAGRAHLERDQDGRPVGSGPGAAVAAPAGGGRARRLGGRTDRRWTVPVASMLALPALWFGGASMLLAAVALAPGRVGGGERPRAADAGGSRLTVATSLRAHPDDLTRADAPMARGGPTRAGSGAAVADDPPASAAGRIRTPARPPCRGDRRRA